MFYNDKKLKRKNRLKMKFLTYLCSKGDLTTTALNEYREMLHTKKRPDANLQLAYRELFSRGLATLRPDLSNLKLAKNAGVFTKPVNKATDWLGIEVEFTYDQSLLPGAHFTDFLRDNGVYFYNLTSDGSLRVPTQDKDGRLWQTAEITLIARASYDFNNVRKLCAALKKLDARVNSKCGLHVHLDYRHILNDSRAAVDKYTEHTERFVRALPLLSSMIHPLRRKNSYAKLGANSARILTGSDRYYAINRGACVRHKTVEIRLHSGTVNADKIIHWCKLLQAIKDLPEAVDISTPADAAKYLKLPDSTLQYIADRVEHFSGSYRDVFGKQKKVVPFADDDSEEHRLLLLGEYDGQVLGALLDDMDKVSNVADFYEFSKVYTKNVQRLEEKLGTRRSLFFMEEVRTQYKQMAAKYNLAAYRDARTVAEWAAKINSASSLVQMNEIEGKLRETYESRRHVESTGINYFGDTTFNILIYMLDARKRIYREKDNLKVIPIKPTFASELDRADLEEDQKTINALAGVI